MKFQIASFIGCVLVFSVQCTLVKADIESALDNDLSDLKNLLKRSYPANAQHEIQQIESDQENSVSPDIPYGYTEFSRHDNIVTAYKLNKTKVSWNEARKSCEEEGAFLAYPVSGREGRKYHHILKRTQEGGAWIGLHDLFAEGEWETVLKKKVDNLKYVNWAVSEPNNYLDNENCAEIYDKDGFWYDTQCDKELVFFCKVVIRTKKNKF